MSCDALCWHENSAREQSVKQLANGSTSGTFLSALLFFGHIVVRHLGQTKLLATIYLFAFCLVQIYQPLNCKHKRWAKINELERTPIIFGILNVLRLWRRGSSHRPFRMTSFLCHNNHVTCVKFCPRTARWRIHITVNRVKVYKMGKKKTRGEGSGLGRALIKERLNAGRGAYRRNDTWVRNYESLILKSFTFTCARILQR